MLGNPRWELYQVLFLLLLSTACSTGGSPLDLGVKGLTLPRKSHVASFSAAHGMEPADVTFDCSESWDKQIEHLRQELVPLGFEQRQWSDKWKKIAIADNDGCDFETSSKGDCRITLSDDLPMRKKMPAENAKRRGRYSLIITRADSLK